MLVSGQNVWQNFSVAGLGREVKCVTDDESYIFLIRLCQRGRFSVQGIKICKRKKCRFKALSFFNGYFVVIAWQNRFKGGFTQLQGMMETILNADRQIHGYIQCI